MPKNPHAASCIEDGAPRPRRMYWPEASVIIVIIALAAVLVTVAGLQATDVLQLLAGAGLVAILIVGLSGGAPRGLRLALRAVLTPGPAV